jgi:hypothetical protein
MGVKFNGGNKFDLQLSEALRNERRLADIFRSERLKKSNSKAKHGYGSGQVTSVLSTAKTASLPASVLPRLITGFMN